MCEECEYLKIDLDIASRKLAALEVEYDMLVTKYFNLKYEMVKMSKNCSWKDCIDTAGGAFRPDEIENANKW